MLQNRFNELEIRSLIDQEKYFVLHAPRQSGKTTSIAELVNKLKQDGEYTALYVNVEAAQASRGKYLEGLKTILNRLKLGIIDFLGQANPGVKIAQEIEGRSSVSGNVLYEFLQTWAIASDKRIILFIDEIDSLVGDTLISVLRQLRDGQVRDLYLQHTQETGQQFTDDAIEYAFYLTQGQPWLVNALAYEACFEMVIDRSKPITKEIVERAK